MAPNVNRFLIFVYLLISLSVVLSCFVRIVAVSNFQQNAELAFYFPVRIWYVFVISTCRGESDLRLRMTSVLAKRMQLYSADFQRILWPT